MKCPHSRSSRPELFCKRGVFKNFAKFTGVSSGTGVSCEFCDILKNTFVRRTPQVAASGICSKRDFLFILYVINQQLRCEYVFYEGVKDFIFTCIFLKIITFFIKISILHHIFSISFTGSKFNS